MREPVGRDRVAHSGHATPLRPCAGGSRVLADPGAARCSRDRLHTGVTPAPADRPPPALHRADQAQGPAAGRRCSSCCTSRSTTARSAWVRFQRGRPHSLNAPFPPDRVDDSARIAAAAALLAGLVRRSSRDAGSRCRTRLPGPGPSRLRWPARGCLPCTASFTPFLWSRRTAPLVACAHERGCVRVGNGAPWRSVVGSGRVQCRVRGADGRGCRACAQAVCHPMLDSEVRRLSALSTLLRPTRRRADVA